MKTKMHRVMMGDGVPAYLNIKPSPGMLAAMRAAMTTSRAYSRERHELAALAYMTWWARSRQIPIPNAQISPGYGVKVLARVIWGWCDAENKQRPCAIQYETGRYESESLYNSRGKFKGYGPTCWHPEKVLLTLAIPNWDHVPAVHDNAARGDRGMMTPREQYAEARRKGLTAAQLRHALETENKWRGQRAAAELLDWLEVAGPVDDIGILSWRYHDEHSPAWEPNLWAELVTLNGETVADISRGRAGGKFYWRIYAASCWAITTDPEARTARDAWGQEAVATYGGPCRSRFIAAAQLVDKLDQLSVHLFQVDILMVPDFAPPVILKGNAHA